MPDLPSNKDEASNGFTSAFRRVTGVLFEKIPPVSANMVRWSFFQDPFGILRVTRDLTAKLAGAQSVKHGFLNDLPKTGIFMTGIESSDPWVGSSRRNQLREAHDFYRNFESRLRNIHALGIRWLRFGPPYSETHIGRGQYNFDFMDTIERTCRELDITIIADLLHFGLPEWMHEQNQAEPFFQNPSFPEEFAAYAEVFARRYPAITFYTPVNEPFVTAHFSSKIGIWNEMRGSAWDDDRAFVKALSNIARAAILGRRAIERVFAETGRKERLVFVQNESFEKAIALEGSGREAEAERFNVRRFASLDLILGHRDSTMKDYLLSQGMAPQNYEWFMQSGSKDRIILGIDHYPWCVHTLEKDNTRDHQPMDPYRLYDLVCEYYARYELPLLHTEINAWPEYAGGMVLQTYDALHRLREEGYPVLGMTWYGDEYQVGWHSALTGPQGFEETPVGLYYKGQTQPVAELFGEMARHGFLPLKEKTKFSFPWSMDIEQLKKIWQQENG